ncbi:thioredoxin family protein [Geminocystis sp. NIES-3709]|uniref:thioredoxin family protein n=1 Tax=Geminocystis sp. NIES-3709 TaxID=1617448 RepID=UPI0005FC97D0|nr:thioredoxin family protein [Geminocystis sp. NIES-3709]BAQ64214.1 thiol:disulfide interchange protein [Geminocystis sp. NIES-3709]
MSENNINPLNRIRNIVIALIAVILGIVLVLSSQTTVNAESLESQAKQATSLEVAVNNGKPSLVEFYANWCTSCQAMAKDLATLKQEYQKDVNFVMLNVDNSKWLPEVLNYEVDGIPHFVFLNNQGVAIASTIGEQPLSIFEENLQALIANKSLPYANNKGNISPLNSQNQIIEGNNDNPTNHS